MTRRLAAAMVAAAMLGLSSSPHAQQPAPGSAAALLARRTELAPQLRNNAFGEPLVLVSRELPDSYEGDVYAEVAHPYAVIAEIFRSPAALCELLFLHPNVHACMPAGSGDNLGLAMRVGPKRSSGGGNAYAMRYTMRTEVAEAAHLRVALSAPQGPLSTHDYRMVFEAVPIDERRSFVHLGYAYGYGMLARIAMGIYLATAGRDKIGFTALGKDVGGHPLYVQGERGAIERNAMRYYLALLAYRSVSAGPADERLQARLRAWYALAERYAPQLHEDELAEYLQEKRDDLARAAADTPAAGK